MSDTSLNRYLAQGDDAAEAAFTPDPATPASGPDPLVLFLNTESTPDLKYWDGANFTSIGGGGSGTVTNTGTLTSGKTIIGNGSADVTVSSLSAQFVGSSSGTAAAASMSTARLLGRTTAGSGAVEEISVGAGLSLSAGSLTATGGSSGLVLLEQHTASTSASLDFTTCISATYDEYRIEFVNVVPASNTKVLILLSTDGGSTWDTSAIYDEAGTFSYVGNTGAMTGFTGGTGFALRDTNTTLSANGSYNASLTLWNPGGAKNKILMGKSYMDDGTVGALGIEIYGRYRNTTAVNAFQVKAESGNLTSGTVRVYGLAKS